MREDRYKSRGEGVEIGGYLQRVTDRKIGERNKSTNKNKEKKREGVT